MIIKVCGLREPLNIRDVESLGVDMTGMIFYKKSPRYVGMIPSNAGVIPDYVSDDFTGGRPSRSRSVGAYPCGCPGCSRPKRVGVFVDEMPQTIITCVYNFCLDYVQLHGSESPILIDNLRRTIDPDIRRDIRFIKVLSINNADDFGQWRIYRGHVDMLLFDTKCSSFGGSGDKFPWALLNAYDGDIPFLLSGGIGPGDAAAVRDINHPMFAGVDLNSRFETAPAVKDIDKLRMFINEIR